VREIRNIYKILIRNTEIKSKYRQEDLNESEKVMDWIHLAQYIQILHHLVFVIVLAQLVQFSTVRVETNNPVVFFFSSG
jgi:hypothetical protein